MWGDITPPAVPHIVGGRHNLCLTYGMDRQRLSRNSAFLIENSVSYYKVFNSMVNGLII